MLILLKPCIQPTALRMGARDREPTDRGITYDPTSYILMHDSFHLSLYMTTPAIYYSYSFLSYATSSTHIFVENHQNLPLHVVPSPERHGLVWVVPIHSTRPQISSNNPRNSNWQHVLDILWFDCVWIHCVILSIMAERKRRQGKG